MLLGYGAGSSYRKVEQAAGRVGLILLAMIVVAIPAVHVRRRRRERATETLLGPDQ